MTVLQNTVTEPDGRALSGWLDVALIGNPFRAATQTEVLGPIKDRQIVAGAWSVDLPPGLYSVIQRRQDGTVHSKWGAKVPDSADAVWLADVLAEVPTTPSTIRMVGITSADVDETGHLQLTYTDGATVDAGPVIGPQGPPYTDSAADFAAAMAAEINTPASDASVALRAASVAAVEAEAAVAPVGTWDFAQVPTVGGVRLLRYQRGVNILEAGASTSSLDNGPLLTQIIGDYSVSAQGGEVHVPPVGDFKTSPFALRSRVKVTGAGFGSRLTLVDGANTHMVTLETANTYEAALQDIALDGNKANQTAGSIVHWDNPAYDDTIALGDPNHLMQRVLLINGKQHGLYVGGSLGQSQFDKVFAYLCDQNGIRVEGPDNHFISCVVAKSGWENFYIASWSLRFLNCKSWLAGAVDAARGDGYYVSNVARIDLLSCESQDNRKHGFAITGSSQVHLVGRADRNGVGPSFAGGAGSSIYLQNVTQSIIDLEAGDRSATLLTEWAYQAYGTNAGNSVRINSGATRSGAVGDGDLGTGDVTVIYDGRLVARKQAPLAASTQTGTAYTLTLNDAGSAVESNNAAANTVTVPPNSTAAFPVGTVIEVHQLGAGQTSLAAGAGVTLRSRGGALKIAGQYGVAALRKRATDEWVAAGDLTT